MISSHFSVYHFGAESGESHFTGFFSLASAGRKRRKMVGKKQIRLNFFFVKL